MIQAWSTAAVQAAETALMAHLGEGELMARAVEGLIEVSLARVREVDARRVVALVGPGNNGADALFAAAGIAAAGVSCAAIYRPGRVHPGAHAAARAAGVVLVAQGGPAGSDPGSDPGSVNSGKSDSPDKRGSGGDLADLLGEADVVIDGIFGIGGRSGLPAWAARWVAAVPDTAYVVSVDVPSGQDPNGGPLCPTGVFADETVTFSVLKPIHLAPQGELTCGRLSVVDIGLAPEGPAAISRLDHDDVASLWPRPVAGDDKYSRGVVGIVAGSETFPGAAVLAVSAAVEAGAGMVRYVGSPTPTDLVRRAVPEAVIGVGRVGAWVIGPGMTDSSEHPQAALALASAQPVVVDAGGLDLIRPGFGRDQATVLTPHAGEAARLWSILAESPKTRAQVETDPLGAARALADLTGAIVLLKGATTVVADAHSVWTQRDAPPWLATAGAGDVLAGVIGTVLAAGLDPTMAAVVGTLIHGVAADRANPGGPVRALRVVQALPATIADLLRRRSIG